VLGSVRGRVTGETGAPIAGVHVTVAPLADGSPPAVAGDERAAETSADGSFVIDEVRAGRIRVLASRDDVSELYAAADAFVLPSVSEGLSNSLLEAMASGLAIVATRIEGVTTDAIEEGESGLLVPPDDPTALAPRLELLAGDAALRRRLGAAARKRAEAAFAIERVAAQHLELYRELVAGRARPGRPLTGS
jgi:glycosyltransferase involved in cell wall biosynthesis